ncbi:MAG: amidohydrolase [Acidimicrobiales bacterium]|nr:amidohydrolase [Acidimicrobiales bacterium]
MVIDTLLDEAADLQADAVALRRRIHRHPELGLDLPRTQAAVLESLDGLGLALATGEATTSVVATLDGGRPGPTVLLRADMDALPMPEDTGLEFASEVDGAMHACGHDAHTSMLVTAVRLLAARRDDLPGRVVFMFQPGEEGHHGARVMLDEGLLDGDAPPSYAFAIHVTPSIPAGMVSTKGGPMMASADELQIVVRGRGGHASMPHLALDPVPVACEIVQALQTMVTRRVDVFDPAVVTIGSIRAGTTTNVIPETAVLQGTVRTVSEGARRRVLDGVRRVAENVAAAHDAQADVVVNEGYPVTVNDDGAAVFAAGVARDLLGDRAVVIQPTPVMGAEDFSYVLQRVPGAMVFLGMHPGGRGTVAPNHSNRMVIDEGPMAAGAALYAAVALRRLSGEP